ncbi:MAG: DUF4350 domain-containing protein [Bacteroidota bacterium]
MKNKSTLLKIGIGTLVAGALAYFYLTTERTTSYNWNPDFKTSSRDPYGCYLFYELLKEGRASERFVEIKTPIARTLEALEVEGATYFFVGEQWYYSEEDVVALSEFVAQGNHAYIISKEAPYTFLSDNGIYSNIYFDSRFDYSASLTFRENPEQRFDYEYLFDWKKKKFSWAYADSVVHPNIDVIGFSSDDKVNFFTVRHGDGKFFFHLTPIVLTNFFLREEDKLDYANKLLSELGDGTIYWDNFSAVPYDESEISQSPLSFILSQESLRWAWYLLLTIGLVYILLYTKRRQRVIPVINGPRNTSIDFIQTIGAMYRHQEAHLRIINHQNQLFLTYIRTKYGISSSNDEKDFTKRVSLKSGIEETEIDMILKEARRLNRKGDITTKDLIAYNQLTEKFYTNCK